MNKQITGIVVSTAMQKTIVIQTERKYRHPLYLKVITKHKKFKAHNELKDIAVGDKVVIEERIDGSIFISLRNKCLNYTVLPARPEKVKMKVIALTRTKSSWKPPANHPWRRPFIISKNKVEQPVSIN